jgi:signal transduction histidine kinase
LLDSLATLIEVTEIKLNKEIPFNDCDIVAIINDIIGQLHSNIYEKSAIIKLDIQVGPVSYPKIYLENIFYNLISNSLKYTSKNTAPEILITTERKDDRICIRVKDNGLGIDLKRYKDRLFKLNQVFHEGYDSKGIGLYITKTQVESLGGTIEVTSVQNEGCEFIVTL